MQQQRQNIREKLHAKVGISAEFIFTLNFNRLPLKHRSSLRAKRGNPGVAQHCKPLYCLKMKRSQAILIQPFFEYSNRLKRSLDPWVKPKDDEWR